MDVQLNNWLLFAHTQRHHAEVEIVSRFATGEMHRYTYNDFGARAQQLMHALDGLECETGGRIGDGRCEAVDADLHLGDSLYADDWMIVLAFGHTPQETEA